MSTFSRFFLLEEEQRPTVKVPAWRLSALRIILTTGLILCLGIFLNSLPAAIDYNLDYVIALTAGYTVSLAGLLYLSRRAFFITAQLLLFSIVMAGLFINLFIPNVTLAHLGSIFMYITPIIALILIGKKTATFYALINILPFLMIVNNIDLSLLPKGQRMLVDAPLHIQLLLFFFLNCCIPLAVWRTSLAANRLNQHMLENNSLLRSQKQIYQRFFQKSYNAILLVDPSLNIVEANDKAKRLLGIQTTPLPLNLSRITKDDITFLTSDNELLMDVAKTFTIDNKCIEVAAQEQHSDRIKAWYLEDVSDQQQMQHDLLALDVAHQQAKYFDKTTNLPNKTWLLEQLQVHIDRGTPFALLIADNLNKHVLDYMIDGEQHRTLYSRINQLVEQEADLLDQIAYIGAGRIAILVETQSSLSETANRWHKNLDFWLKLGQHQFHSKYAIGIATYPEHGYVAERLLKNALQACELRAPEQMVTIFDQLTRRQTLARHEMALLLEKSIELGELKLYLQSKHDIDKNIIGYEALARWHSNLLGWVPPSQFIPIAEEFGLVSYVTRTMLEMVCQFLTKNSYIDVPIAINISSRDIADPEFVNDVQRITQAYGISPSSIELELTEYSFADDHNHTMNRLEELGFILSIDDFGTGYSNIARVLECPIKRLKLDRSLLTDINDVKKQHALLLGLITICDNMHISLLAEGVETHSDYAMLCELGIKEFQGYWFSKPCAADKLVMQHKAHQSGSATLS
ncbi:GGDEF domain-containing phosphodiesterase [Pseudoalteromonas luteoviolacea]|uniref:GGDEF domain-containing phosphodiesterase n=1 Tax=Pseudoalteromonas luteoviolacea TaxID=43657 RepID=UPI00114FD2CE|nr:GGDEF domain-containing phosphodiesterase [Pseudoalteromonas luteoviolacea]TQF71021.1 EAL domain-containing protein [Pseudoalteromonas luteoviolacea]